MKYANLSSSLIQPSSFPTSPNRELTQPAPRQTAARPCDYACCARLCLETPDCFSFTHDTYSNVYYTPPVVSGLEATQPLDYSSPVTYCGESRNEERSNQPFTSAVLFNETMLHSYDWSEEGASSFVRLGPGNLTLSADRSVRWYCPFPYADSNAERACFKAGIQGVCQGIVLTRESPSFAVCECVQFEEPVEMVALDEGDESATLYLQLSNAEEAQGIEGVVDVASGSSRSAWAS